MILGVHCHGGTIDRYRQFLHLSGLPLLVPPEDHQTSLRLINKKKISHFQLVPFAVYQMGSDQPFLHFQRQWRPQPHPEIVGPVPRLPPDKPIDEQYHQRENNQYLEYLVHRRIAIYRVSLVSQSNTMDLHLNGKTALVLAASKGLGKACAVSLVKEGADVIIGARNRDALETTANELRALGTGRVLALPVDVQDARQAEEMVATVAATFGKIDILVNNAGGPPFGKFTSFDDAAWQSAFNLTLLSAIRFSRLVIPHMRPTGSGRIINIVSLTVKTFLPNSVLSTSLRMGVVGMAKMLSHELGPDNITVNNVAPGLILTDRVKDTFPDPTPGGPSLDQMLAQRANDIPLRRIGKPEELAALVTFLASPLAGYITGATVLVDGGASMAQY
jgi:3-oxoacyl-[acyl-carrier protein] reductase